MQSRAGLARANVDRGGDPLNLSSVADVEARAPVRLGRVESEVKRRSRSLLGGRSWGRRCGLQDSGLESDPLAPLSQIARPRAGPRVVLVVLLAGATRLSEGDSSRLEVAQRACDVGDEEASLEHEVVDGEREGRYSLSLRMHPDKNDSPDASEAFKRVQGAYEVLMSTHKAAYDNDLRRMQEERAADKGETSEEEWSYRFGDLTASVVRAVTGNQDYEFGAAGGGPCCQSC